MKYHGDLHWYEHNNLFSYSMRSWHVDPTDNMFMLAHTKHFSSKGDTEAEEAELIIFWVLVTMCASRKRGNEEEN